MSKIARHIQSRHLRSIVLAASMLMLCGHAPAAEALRKTFAAPEDGAKELIAAVKAGNEADLLDILGPSLKEWINSGDPVADQQARDKVVAAYEQKQAIETAEPGKAVLVIGDDGFPFPIPLVKTGDKWAFDPALGKQEMIDRRIGRNELATIQALLAVTDAQNEYAALEREGKGGAEYAQKFMSSRGKRDGLYWPTTGGEPQSPLGALAAEASRAGYKPGERPSGAAPTPFNGYYFRMLFEQGASAPGGAYSYLVKGRMIGGFAAIAWPVKYGVSGYKTFMVSHDQIVYEADLGPKTEQVAAGIRSFDPGKRWTKVDAR